MSPHAEHQTTILLRSIQRRMKTPMDSLVLEGYVALRRLRSPPLSGRVVKTDLFMQSATQVFSRYLQEARKVAVQ